eukprot:Gregarina_sp_Poly_1__3423@NODE_1994_length_2909_cov_18_463758_g1287_i0_p2_GENE_NODE_1994_length_2909_cov_18_463758_g1287_i0NODE_1994_length_2909_cov_18_463758_g1287_i0_p2_ORF_typecomplete_len154_score14_78DUF3577/PF12101_8/0_16DUF3577/PF12101_8/4_9e03DUF3577/PF12101_8/3_3e03_NODE_1994_length_2909_cov_18_463758_g1287_i023352796
MKLSSSNWIKRSLHGYLRESRKLQPSAHNFRSHLWFRLTGISENIRDIEMDIKTMAEIIQKLLLRIQTKQDQGTTPTSAKMVPKPDVKQLGTPPKTIKVDAKMPFSDRENQLTAKSDLDQLKSTAAQKVEKPAPQKTLSNQSKSLIKVKLELT